VPNCSSVRKNVNDGSVTLSLLSFLAVKKCIALILLTLLPLQLAWAAASVYCSHHEQGESAEHFGHHPDEHGALEITLDFPAPDDADGDDGSQPVHTDHHHAGTCGLLPCILVSVSTPSAGGLEAHVSTQPPASPASLIERPNWHVLA